jgi:4-hydroxy-tetrahydrodipicolinate synthase
MNDSQRQAPLAFDRARLRTVHLVPLTAFDANDRLAPGVQERHIARMYDSGIRVFLPAAGTSEFHNLSRDEVVDLVGTTVRACGPDASVFAPVGLQLRHAIELAARSMEAGAQGVMFMPFTHPYLSDQGALDYYRAVLDAVDAPALIYKKGPVPSDALLLELAADRRVVGVKYAENNLHDFRRVVLADQGRVEWLCGSAERFAPYFMLAGATGYTTGAGNLCPNLTLAMHAALSSGEYAEAMRYQRMILPIEEFRGREAESFNVSMLKHAMRLCGEDFGIPRPPLRRLSHAEQAAVAELLTPVLAAERDLRREAASVGLVRES